jgi:hypothetical protein
VKTQERGCGKEQEPRGARKGTVKKKRFAAEDDGRPYGLERPRGAPHPSEEQAAEHGCLFHRLRASINCRKRGEPPAPDDYKNRTTPGKAATEPGDFENTWPPTYMGHAA